MDEYNNFNQEEEELELSHTDKAVGVFAEPGKTFADVAKEGPKVTDWLIPIIITILIVIASTLIIYNTPALKMKVIEKQMEAVQKNFDEAVEAGQMSQEAADSQIQVVYEQMEKSAGIFMISQIVAGIVVVFVVFFLMAAIYLLIFNLFFKSQMSYGHVLSVTGLVTYISLIEALFILIYMLATENLAEGLNLGVLMGIEKDSFVNFLLFKIAPLKIWALIVTGIGLSKISVVKDTAKYVYVIVGLWFAWSVLMYFLGSAVPVLSFLKDLA